MNLKQIKDGNYAGKTYTVSYEDIVEAAEAVINSVGFEYRDLQDFKANVNLVLPANVVDGAVKEAYRNSKKNVSDSRVSDDDDAFDEYFDYSEEAMEENDKVNDKCGGKRKVKDSDEDSEIILSQIADFLLEGYHYGYDPIEWSVDVRVDGQDISDFPYEDQDVVYENIAYPIKDGYDNYQGVEVELSDGSIAYVDYVVNF